MRQRNLNPRMSMNGYESWNWDKERSGS
jgi:hypothetical protein